MRSFFKIFFASFLSLAIFSLVVFFILVGIVSSIASSDKPEVSSKSVLVIDLSKTFHERMQPDILGVLTDEGKVPGLYDVIRLINHAKSDNDVSGIMLYANGNANGFASSNELRSALIDFRTSKKFVLAHGDMMSQEA